MQHAKAGISTHRRIANHILATVFIAISTILNLACGGSGGGTGATSEPTITITSNIPELLATAHYRQGTYNGSSLQAAPVTVSLNPEPSGTAYSRIVADNVGFVGAMTQIYDLGNGYYSAQFMPDTYLAPGNYSGTLSLTMFKDSGFTQPYPTVGGTLPFTVSITPQLTMNAYVNGSKLLYDVTPIQPGNGLTVDTGDTIQIDSNLPVHWMYSAGPGLVMVTPTQDATPTSWRAVIELPLNPGAYAVTLIGMAQDGSPQSISVNVMVNVPVS